MPLSSNYLKFSVGPHVSNWGDNLFDGVLFHFQALMCFTVRYLQ